MQHQLPAILAIDDAAAKHIPLCRQRQGFGAEIDRAAAEQGGEGDPAGGAGTDVKRAIGCHAGGGRDAAAARDRQRGAGRDDGHAGVAVHARERLAAGVDNQLPAGSVGEAAIGEAAGKGAGGRGEQQILAAQPHKPGAGQGGDGCAHCRAGNIKDTARIDHAGGGGDAARSRQHQCCRGVDGCRAGIDVLAAEGLLSRRNGQRARALDGAVPDR